MNQPRRFPAGLQVFSDIIEGGYAYVDKTDLMWRMQNLSKYIFLSRPRRFGKTMLSFTLRSFFEGRRDLFEGLKVMELEKEWKSYPVLQITLSEAKDEADESSLVNKLKLILSDYSGKYGRNPEETTPGGMLRGLIRRAYEQTGNQVVVLIDEYDAPLLSVLQDEKRLESYRRVLQELYTPLKASEQMLKFCFITGITKFSQLSIFSTIINVTNISLTPDFATICGITEQELTTQLADGIQKLADYQGVSSDEMHERLRQKYDGYHFAEKSEGVYNPFSVMKAFLLNKLDYYWFDSGTPSYLFHQMQHFHTDITALDNIEVPAQAFDLPTEAMTDALPLLYQSGYLTIKEFDPESEIYTLSIPNQEVRVGFTQGLLPAFVSIDAIKTQTGFALKFWRALKKHDINLAMEEFRAYLSSLPYITGFKDKLKDISTKEGFYEWSLYLIFSMLNIYVVTQVRCAGGRIDVVVHMPDTIYVLELKMRGTAQSALDQINQKGYARQYSTSNKNIVKMGILFSPETRNIEEWVVE